MWKREMEYRVNELSEKVYVLEKRIEEQTMLLNRTRLRIEEICDELQARMKEHKDE